MNGESTLRRKVRKRAHAMLTLAALGIKSVKREDVKPVRVAFKDIEERRRKRCGR